MIGRYDTTEKICVKKGSKILEVVEILKIYSTEGANLLEATSVEIVWSSLDGSTEIERYRVTGAEFQADLANGVVAIPISGSLTNEMRSLLAEVVVSFEDVTYTALRFELEVY